MANKKQAESILDVFFFKHMRYGEMYRSTAFFLPIIIQKREKHAGKQCKIIFAVNLGPQFSLAASAVVVASYKEMVFFFCGEKFICQQ